MKKQFLSILVLLLLLCTLSAQTMLAAEPRSYSSGPFLDFRGSTASCSAKHYSNSSTDTVGMTLSLYENNTYITSWSSVGNGGVIVSGEYPVEYGKTYRLEMVYYINGIKQPAKSVTATCRRQ